MPETTETTKLEFGCPNCDWADVWENNRVQVRLRVESWGDDGEPADFGKQTTIDDTIETVPSESDGGYGAAPRYYCNNCGHEFETPKPLNDAAKAAMPDYEDDISEAEADRADSDQVCDPIADQRMDAADVALLSERNKIGGR